MPQQHLTARRSQHKAEGARDGSHFLHNFSLLEKSHRNSQSYIQSSLHSEAVQIYLASATRSQSSEQRSEYFQDAPRLSKKVGE